MPLSVISLSTFLLYQIPFSRTMLYQIPFSCYTWFRYTWFRYTRFHFLVIPDSRIKFPCYTWFRYTCFCYTTFHILVMPDSVIAGSVIPLSYFPSYNWFRYTPFRYAQVRYTRFPIPLTTAVVQSGNENLQEELLKRNKQNLDDRPSAAGCSKTQLSNQCQQEVLNKLNGHPVVD